MAAAVAVHGDAQSPVAHVRRRSCGASFSMPARPAAARTTSRSTFGEMPAPASFTVADSVADLSHPFGVTRYVTVARNIPV